MEFPLRWPVFRSYWDLLGQKVQTRIVSFCKEVRNVEMVDDDVDYHDLSFNV